MAWRNHQTPEFYLKYFAGRDPRGSSHLWVYDKIGEGQPRPQTPENANVERDYYSFETRAGINGDLETLFGQIESRGAPILTRLQEPNAIPNRYEVEFLALLFLRVPRARDVSVEFTEVWAFQTLRILCMRPDLLARILE